MEFLAWWAFSGIVFWTLAELVDSVKHDPFSKPDWLEGLVLGTVFGPLLFFVFVRAIFK